MLVLRLMLMVLTIISLMDGHAEVSSSTTGIRNRTESPVVKPNEPEVQIFDRKKKKKPKKPKKPSKKKKPKPKKPKPAKPVTTTQTMTTSTLKTTTILTTPTMETTATTTDSPTTTATTFKTTTSTTSTTTSVTTTSTATTTEATSSTASITTATTTIPTTTTTTTAATTADSGAEGECKATNGKPCIFPFKDGNEDYNECKNHGGTYFWCATAVYESGKYKHWSYCPKDGPCPLEGDGECRAKDNKPCVFPFKDGKKEYNECADHGGQYFWCATGTNSAGKYTAWSECPKDGSCPLPQKSTTPAMTSTATAASTTPLITGTTAAIYQMEEKVLGTLENLVLGESRDDSLQMAHMLEKKLDTIIKDLEGETSKSELSNFDDIPPQSGKLNLTLKRDQDDKIRDGTQLGKGLMFVLSTVDSMKSVSRMSGDCCLDCKTKYPDTELAEYWETLDTCYCYKKFKNPDVEPKTRASSKFTTKACAADPTIEDKCCETLTLSASSGAAQHQGHRLGTYKKDGEHNNKAVYKQQDGTNVLHYFRESNQFRWTFASSLSSGGGLSSKLGDTSVCPSDVQEWQYYWPGTNNLWLVDSTVAVDCEEGYVCLSKSRLFGQEKLDGGCPALYTYVPAWNHVDIMITDTYLMEKGTNINICSTFCVDDCHGFSWEWCSEEKKMICRVLRPKTGAQHPLFVTYLPRSMDFCKKGIITCSPPLIPPSKEACPPGYENNIDGFPQEPDYSQVISRESINSKEKCKEACDDKQENCLGFYFNTCDKENKPYRCLLLNVDKVDVTVNKNNNVFCKREPQGTFEECQCPNEEYPCDRCLISGRCQNTEFDCKEEDICYIEKNQNRDGYIPCGMSVAIKAIEFCINYKHTSRMPQKPNDKRGRTTATEEHQEGGKPLKGGRTGSISRVASVNFKMDEESKSEEELEIYTIPMGQGDSTIIQCPGSNKITIIDIGGKGGRGINRDTYFQIIKDRDIENIFLTHPDEDHVNYFSEVMKTYIENLPNPKKPINIFTAGYLALLNIKVDGLIKDNEIFTVYETVPHNGRLSCGHYEDDGKTNFIPCKFAKVQSQSVDTNNNDGDHLISNNVVNICNNFQITLMAANYHFASRRNIKNEMSLVLKVTPNDVPQPSILITGDFESPTERKDPVNPFETLQLLLQEGPEGEEEEEEEVDQAPPDYEKYLAKFHSMLVEASESYYKQSSQKTLMNGLESTVLIVPHHGSYSKGNGVEMFFYYINPTYAIISADPYYGYGHPRCEVIINLVKTHGRKNKMNTDIVSTEIVSIGSDNDNSDLIPINCLIGKASQIQYLYTKSKDKKNHIFQTIMCTAKDPKNEEDGCIKIPKSIPQQNKKISLVKTIMTKNGIKSVEYANQIFTFTI